jgi:hypothetical protein
LRFSVFLSNFGILALLDEVAMKGPERLCHQFTHQSMIDKLLGFNPTQPDAQLTEKISTLYRRPGTTSRYELHNLSRKLLPEGDMYLFDLVDTSGEDNSWLENQAVAIISPSLKLPPFSFFPKSDEKYALSGLANQIVEWGLAKIGSPVTFPEFPAFAARYVVSSSEPQAIRRFIDEPIARYFSHTPMYSLRACGEVFTFSEMDPRLDLRNPESLSRRVNRALEIFHLLQKA